MSELDSYRVEGVERLRTPALLIYPDIVDSNIRTTLAIVGGNPDRWRPHVKTVKMAYIIRRMVEEHGIRQVKCATTLELSTSLAAGVTDALLAYPVVGANAERVKEIAAEYPSAKVSVLVETAKQAEIWKGSAIGVFIDVNPGMNRTGIEQDHVADLVELAKSIPNFRGLHYYDGHMHIADPVEREKEAHKGYAQLMRLTEALAEAGKAPEEVITSGTPALQPGATFAPFQNAPFVHRVSPGTVTFCDTTSMGELPAGYKPAALVVASVVSHPIAGRFTVDAGHKSVSADAGVPTCQVVGANGEFTPLKPSEEHLPIDSKGTVPEIGSYVYLVPRHVCPTVNNFDDALIIQNNKVVGTEKVTARGHEPAYS
ncbi:threonine aldolase [Bryobacterales bacterium F-183]|nr:threonine aldolase [Bryobacterales bacterium F-183]